MAAAAGATVTEIFGVGPVIAATIISGAGDISRLPGRDHFAARNGTAPIEVSSGPRKISRPGEGWHQPSRTARTTLPIFCCVST